MFRGSLWWHHVRASTDARIPAVTFTLFPALRNSIPRGVTKLQVTHAVICADHLTMWERPPPHLALLVDQGVPVMAFGKPGPCQALEHCIRGSRPAVAAVEVRCYLRPSMAPIGADHAYAVRTAYIIGLRERLKQNMPNYVTLDAGHCMGSDNPPMPLVDLFVHALTRGDPKPDTVAMYCKDPMTATLWSMVATKHLDVLVGVLAETMEVEEWQDAVMRGGDQPTPPGLEPEFRPRVQALLGQGIPAWAALEDAVLRDSWARKEREQAAAEARSAAKKAAKAKTDAELAAAKAEKARAKAEAEAAERVKGEPHAHLIGIPDSEEGDMPGDQAPATPDNPTIRSARAEEDVDAAHGSPAESGATGPLPRVPSWHSVASEPEEGDAEEEEEEDLPRAPAPAPPRRVAVEREPRVEEALTQPPPRTPKPHTKAGGRPLSQGASPRSDAPVEGVPGSAAERMAAANAALRAQEPKGKRHRKGE